MRKQTVGKSLAGNDITMLVLTNFKSPPEEIANREAIFLTARAHPSETHGSFIIEGLI
jgi:hypothetical protein